MPKSLEITVAATWEDRVPARVDNDGHVVSGYWTTYGDDEPEMLRASLAPKRLTVWLPSGKRVQCRRRQGIRESAHTTREFYHAWSDRFGDLRRIKFVIADDVPLNGET